MINFQNIEDSIKFYSGHGFQRIESPWTVSQAVSDITKPPDKENFKVVRHGKEKVLVASGEQSFLYLYLKGFLPHGKFQTVTPCFRDEVFDDLHTKYFIKNELIWTTTNMNGGFLNSMVQNALAFFQSKLNPKYVKIAETNDPSSERSFDIEYVLPDRTIELGSYGIRSTTFVKWIYGTGCAEPRLSFVQDLHLRRGDIAP